MNIRKVVSIKVHLPEVLITAGTKHDRLVHITQQCPADCNHSPQGAELLVETLKVSLYCAAETSQPATSWGLLVLVMCQCVRMHATRAHWQRGGVHC